ncbi:MAG: SGNH/GDSL hydrolase family protein [Nitrospinae bacterium]|nr:SGNH/GDSL hydrolase family protein [Nitrospinota bacterium]
MAGLVVMAEIVMRIGVAYFPESSLFAYAKPPERNGYYPSPFVFDPTTGWRHPPGFTGDLVRPSFSNRYRLNNYGFHDTDWTREKEKGVFRIALLGHSYLAAFHVGVHETWALLLEERLTKILGRRVEILNFGMPAANLWNQERLLNHVAFDFDPDAVIVWEGLGPGDYLPKYHMTTARGDIIVGSSAESLFDMEKRLEGSGESLKIFLGRMVFVARAISRLAGKRPLEDQNYVRASDGLQPAPNLDHTGLFIGMAARCRERGVMFGVYGSNERQETSLALEEIGIPLVDDKGQIDTKREGYRLKGDGHFSREGHRLYADESAPFFAALIGKMEENHD